MGRVFAVAGLGVTDLLIELGNCWVSCTAPSQREVLVARRYGVLDGERVEELVGA